MEDVGGQSPEKRRIIKIRVPSQVNSNDLGMRGPVKSYEEGKYTINTPDSDSDLSHKPELWHRLEFDMQGKLTEKQTRYRNGIMWNTKYIYDANGLLITEILGQGGENPLEISHTYDTFGRIVKTTSNCRDEPVATYIYELSRIFKVQRSAPAEYELTRSEAGSPFEVADRSPNLPGGGEATTFYNGEGRPYEVQVHDDKGLLVRRALCLYGDTGELLEEACELIDSARFFQTSSTDFSQISGDIFINNRSEHLVNVLDKLQIYAMKYLYDAQKRLVEVATTRFGSEEIIRSAYNDDGDILLESRLIKGSDLFDDKDELTERSFSYIYDLHRNWIEKSVIERVLPTNDISLRITFKRVIDYF